METDDPRAALGNASVATRCAGARDLARHGTLEDLERLATMGWQDKSMAVRLYAAAAAADIVQRHRDGMDASQHAQAVKYAFAGDPGHTPSMIMLASYAPPSTVLHRLGRILRDPRSDVRLAVLTTLRRMLLSSRCDRDAVVPTMATWFDDPKIPADATVELAKLVGEAGLSALRGTISGLRGTGEGADEVLGVALARLEARATRDAWIGAWWSDGRDVYENRAPDPDLAVAVCDGDKWFSRGATRAVHPGAVPTLDDDPVARIFATPLGTHEALPAIQVDGRTWWAVAPDDFATFLDVHHLVLRTLPQAGRQVLVARAEALGGAASERVRSSSCWIAGDLDGALEAADAQLARKRPRGDAWFWRARVLHERGDKAGASEALEAFLGKAKKDHPLKDAAEALQQG